MMFKYEQDVIERNSDMELDFGDMNFNPTHLDPAKFVPVPQTGPPSTEPLSELSNFLVEIDGSNTHRKKFLYSHKCNRLYVNSMHNFSVGFSWDATKVRAPTYVRTTIVFADPSDAEKRVQTCLQHIKDDKVTSEAINCNVLRSSRELNDPNVFYSGNPHNNDWYSVVVHLPSPSSHAFYFVCKNSCSSGINRRPLNFIFTLENDLGDVFGRQIVGVRVCSCPKRDMCRDESSEEPKSGKRHFKVEIPDTTNTANENNVNTTNTVNGVNGAIASNVTTTPRRKRVRVEPDACDAIVTIPSFEVMGPRVALAGLEVMLSMMKQTKDMKIKIHQNVEDITTKIVEIEKLIENIEEAHHSVSLL